jgi:biopolymer transport protein ExbD
LLAPQSLKISLPKTESVAHADKLPKLSLVIDAQGGVSYESARLDDDHLAALLKQHAADPQFQLQLQADEAVNYGRVAQIMAIAQKSGVSKLSFLTLAGRK